MTFPDSVSKVSPPRSAFIKGLPISLVSVGEVLAEMDRAIKSRESGHYISITNTEAMYHGLRIPEQGDYIRGADFSLCDGVGVVAAGFAWGHRLRRLNGPVLQLECSRHGVVDGWRHFFYGGKEGVAEAMAARLRTWEVNHDVRPFSPGRHCRYVARGITVPSRRRSDL